MILFLYVSVCGAVANSTDACMLPTSSLKVKIEPISNLTSLIHSESNLVKHCKRQYVTSKTRQTASASTAPLLVKQNVNLKDVYEFESDGEQCSEENASLFGRWTSKVKRANYRQSKH